MKRISIRTNKESIKELPYNLPSVINHLVDVLEPDVRHFLLNLIILGQERQVKHIDLHNADVCKLLGITFADQEELKLYFAPFDDYKIKLTISTPRYLSHGWLNSLLTIKYKGSYIKFEFGNFVYDYLIKPYRKQELTELDDF